MMMMCLGSWVAVVVCCCCCLLMGGVDGSAVRGGGTTTTANYYVDVRGSDDGDGSQAHPFRTVQRAQAAARSAAKSGGVNVYLNNGTFFLNSTLVFTPQDSGLSASQPIVYQSTSKTNPAQLTSAVEITGWKKVGNTTLGHIWEAPLPAGVDFFHQLWINGRRQHVARQPTRAYEKATPNSVIFKPGQLTAVPHNLDDAYVVLYESWTASLHQIASIDMDTRNITLKTTYNNKWSGSAAGSRYYLASIVEALPTPGYFYVDRHARTVSLCTNNKTDPNAEKVVAATQIELIRVQGNATAGQFVRNIHFRNLDIRYSAVDVSTCFSSSCDAQSADFLTTATIHITGGDDGSWCYSLCSHDAVVAEGCGVLAQLVAHTIIQHNLIFNFSYGVFNSSLTQSHVADVGAGGVRVGVGMTDIGLSLLSDMGCVYTLGKQPGTQVINNICHTVYTYNYGGWGLYTDEGSSYIQLRDNIVFHTKCAGVHQHYGTDNTFSNNILAEVNTLTCDAAIRSSQHPGNCTAAAPDGACSSFTFDTNIVYVRDYDVFDATIPTGFQNMTFDNNTYWKGDKTPIVFPEKKTFKQWKAEGKDVHSVIADPQFVDGTHNDWSRFNSNSPALKLGFKPINISQVGPVALDSPLLFDHHEHVRRFVDEGALHHIIVW
ncbi:hypothetical protein PTSG_11897 [Salpingoeca rosetta]|uniref:Right handed beta helix domain-containing protein n=1 Tax=Salpingoeca rosetta (strain ATCC 50818 / BSB-021) TaxID=946362 RepID=F2U2T3_SALR5|nr:uncharacterized protein PTSG_11897 [Salpingoeca rosetta]EGD81927.1 hypothetical protein PTSG_11897 [Salpingoeca rosetta]|eukprot:XP_004996110.1 hypothetical protein PTSG_11897 [Salpingoeca rosetta]